MLWRNEMEFKRSHAVVLLVFTYFTILYGMYKSLSLGPLDASLLRFADDPLEQGYKMFFFSMVNAPIVYLAFLVTFLCSIMYLRSRDAKYDAVASSSAKLGILFCTILLTNGAIFSKLAWRVYWNWDPRQTTTLFLWFIMASYLSLRTALTEPEKRARLSAVVGILGFVGVPLTHVSATVWTSNHPQLYTEGGFKLGSAEISVFLVMLAGMLALYIYLLWLTVKIERMVKA